MVIYRLLALSRSVMQALRKGSDSSLQWLIALRDQDVLPREDCSSRYCCSTGSVNKLLTLCLYL